MAKLANVLCFLSVAAVTWLGCVAGMWSWTGFIPMGAALVTLLVPLVPAIWLGILVNRWRRSTDSAQVAPFVILLAMVAPTILLAPILGAQLFGVHSLWLHGDMKSIDQGVGLGVRKPAGSALAWIGDESEIPTGWFIADGRSLAKADYKSVFAHFGTAHGADEDTFNLPDYRGMHVSIDKNAGYGPVLHGEVRIDPPTSETTQAEIHWLIYGGE